MLIQEAKWFAEQIASCEPTEIFPMCNVGSSTETFRRKDQPFIDKLIFAPVVQKGQVVKHLDIKPAFGVDIVGDLSDPLFLKKLKIMRFKSIFCSNLLEHVTHRESICTTLTSIVPSGGYLFVSVPYSYPYHPDPNDSGFRPCVAELASLFPNTRLIRSAVVGDDTLLWLRRRNPLVFAFTLMRIFIPFYKPVSWWKNRGYLPWLFRRLTASCIILQKD